MSTRAGDNSHLVGVLDKAGAEVDTEVDVDVEVDAADDDTLKALYACVCFLSV